MVHLVSLPMPETEGSPKFFSSNDPVLVEGFVAAENRPGWGVYDILNPLKPGATRHSKENISGVCVVFVDTDAKDIEQTREEAEQRLKGAVLRPTWINDSGHGWHIGFELKEEILRDDDHFDRVVALQEQLIEYFAGDPQVRLWSLLRRPGTTNFKEEPFVPCHTIATGSPVDITEIEAFCDLVQGTTLLTRKPKHGNGRDDDEDAPRHTSGPIDWEARLDNIRWHGHGDSSINITQRDVMGSLLRRGIGLDEATQTVLEATRRCVAGDPDAAGWNWHAEELKVAFSGARLVNKDRTLLDRLPDDLRSKFEALERQGLGPTIRKNNYKLFVYPAEKPKGQATGNKNECDDTLSGASGSASGRGADAKTVVIEARPFVRFDPAKIPPREWLYGNHYQRGVVTATVGPGGGGKSSLNLVEMIAMCTARNLLGEQPLLRCKAWYHNAEDSLDEIYRRIAAVCQHYDIDQSELEGWLFVTSGLEVPIKISATRNGTVSIDTKAAGDITRTIVANEIVAASFDPLIAHHRSVENVTGDMDQVVREFARIANVTDCSIEIVHHTRKPAPGQEELSVMDSRGAGAIINAVRSARVLNAMSKSEAEKARLDEVDRGYYFRIDRGKANMAPPTGARWHKFVSVELPNTDDVGVVTQWTFPGQGGVPPGMAEAERQADDLFLSLLVRFTMEGRNVSASAGANYAPNLFAKEQEAKSVKIGKHALVDAMNRLFAAKRIRVDQSGEGGHRVNRIVVIIPDQGK